jgi:LacI family transcriptional regulator, galactose operon repressor
MMKRNPKKTALALPATMDDIARATRLSKMTVSRALSNSGYVSSKTRDKVLAAAGRLNYEINFIGRQLTSNRTGLLGVITSFEGFVGTYYFGRIIEGLQQGLFGTEYHLTLYDSANEDFNDGLKCAKLCHQRRVDGLAVIAPHTGDKFIHTFYELRVPLIVIGASPEHKPISYVDVDNFGGAYAATKHLIDLGHRKIGHISGPMNVTDAQQREAAFRKALADKKISVNPRWILEGDFMTRTAYDGCLKLLASKERPTAIFAANDLMAIGVMDAARTLGLKIPGDLSLVGFDDVRGADTTSPPLTTVHQPSFQLGKVAANYLLEVIGESTQGPVRHEKLPANLVIRSSTAAPGGAVRP